MLGLPACLLQGFLCPIDSLLTESSEELGRQVRADAVALLVSHAPERPCLVCSTDRGGCQLTTSPGVRCMHRADGLVSEQEDAAGTFKLADGTAIADERELRQLVRPEEWCGHESMTAGLIRLARTGVTKQERLAALPLDRLRVAVEQLSPPEVPLFASDVSGALRIALWGLVLVWFSGWGPHLGG